MKYLIIFLFLMLCGCQNNENVMNANVRQKVTQPVYVLSEMDINKRFSSTKITQQNQVQLINPASEKDALKVIPNQDYVFAYDVLQESTGVCDDWLNCSTGAYVYPFININDEQASEINQMTYRRVSRMIERDEYDAENIKATYEYKTYLNNNILSVIIKWQSFYSKAVGGMWNVDDDRIFVTYNYDLETKSELSNLELIKRYGFTIETYEESIINQLKEMGIEVTYEFGLSDNLPENAPFVYYSTEGGSWHDPYGVQLNEDDSCIYIDENGKLAVLIEIFTGPNKLKDNSYIKLNL